MSTEPKNKDKVFLYVDNETFNYHKQKEDKIFSNVAELTAIARACLGDEGITDWIAFLENPIDTLVNSYWERYGHNFNPPSANWQDVFNRNNNVSLQRVTALQTEILALSKELKQYSPTINKKGVKRGLEIDAFKKYLAEDKAEKYYALKRFIEASDELLKHGLGSGTANLVRFAPSFLSFNGLKVKINLQKFT
jgi:hypothetical protein